jgi:hypothetical protein
MEKVVASASLQEDAIGRELVNHLDDNEHALSLQAAVLYYDFPIFRDYDDDIYKASILILSPRHGLIAIYQANLAGATDPAQRLGEADEALSQFEALLFSRLIKSPKLRKNRRELQFPISGCLYMSLIHRAAPVPLLISNIRFVHPSVVLRSS